VGRLVAIVAIALAAGAVAGALVGRITDDDSKSTTVVVDEPVTTTSETAATPIPRSRFDPAAIFARRAGGVVTIYAVFSPSEATGHASQGSGFVVSRDGYVMTNAHVITTAPSSAVHGASDVFVEFEDGDRTTAKIVGWDLFSDVGVLKVDPGAHGLSPVPLGDSSRVAVGEPVAAIGSPFGRQNSLTVGVVSGTRRSISSLTSDYDLADAIQVDAPINRGNSGGPLFDASGRVIGINAQIRSESGVNEGVGFAVPINAAKRAMRDLIAGGRVRYAYVGVSTQDLTPAVARELGYDASYGAVIRCVEDGSPAARAGLKGGDRNRLVLGRETVDDGDVIVGIGDDPVRSGADLVRIVSEELRPGRAARFTIIRGDSRRQLRITPGERPSRPSGSCG
jgi:2-alkenal reductase